MLTGLLRLPSVGRLHITAIAALGTFTFGWLFTGLHPWLLAGVSALDWTLVNLLNRVVDLQEDRVNEIPGTDFVGRHQQGIRRGGLLVLAISLVLLHPLLGAVTGLRLTYHALGLAYNWPLLPGGRRIKQLYFWKNTASALGFLITVFGYPLALGLPYPPGIDLSAVVVSMAFFTLFELSYEVIYDLRDVAGDRAAGVRTYPVVHGVAAAVRIADGLILSSLVVLLGGWIAGSIPWRIAVMGAAPLLQFVIYKRAITRGITSRDCVNITWTGVGLLVAFHLWVAAGLPGV
ncbi:MAG: UbiA family prenyltransferase [Pseudomonadota bacterium]